MEARKLGERLRAYVDCFAKYSTEVPLAHTEVKGDSIHVGIQSLSAAWNARRVCAGCASTMARRSGSRFPRSYRREEKRRVNIHSDGSAGNSRKLGPKSGNWWRSKTGNRARRIAWVEPGGGQLRPNSRRNALSLIPARCLCIRAHGLRTIPEIDGVEAATVNTDGRDVVAVHVGGTKADHEGEPLNARVGPQGACVWFKLAPVLHDRVCAFEDEP